jgi:rSAM/selenodomain-associated transferase 2
LLVLSVIIPTLNASRTLPATLACLRGCDLPNEIIVVDGGSTDFTRVEADRAGAKFLDAPRGRGTQLAAGAEAAEGEWFLFLHADTVLEEGWSARIAPVIADADDARRAFHFRFAIDDDRPAARWLERLVHWRNRRFALPYGDQGLLINAAFYREIGGFRKLPLMEDVDLVRRIGRGRISALPVTALTSSAKYEGWALVYRPPFNLLCLSLYFVGLPPSLLARLY